MICQRTIPKSICGKTPFVAMPIIREPFDPGKTNMDEGDTEWTNASDSGLCAVLLYDGVHMPVMYRAYNVYYLRGEIVVTMWIIHVKIRQQTDSV